MINVIPFESLEKSDHGWLKASHHFSFSKHHNPNRIRFGQLRIVNDDLVKAGSGFDMHHHKDMEIITFVRKGAVTHKDSKGNTGRTEAGSVQVMSAGTGIYHSEFNLESVDTSIYQIWIYPKTKGVQPRWDTTSFSDRKAKDSLPLLVSGRSEDKAKGALFIHQDASIYGGSLVAGQNVDHPIIDQAYLLISKGKIEVLGEMVKKGDGLEITNQSNIKIKALTNAEVILIDVPA